MQTRREFLKNAAIISGAVGLWGALDGPIKKALAIDPEPGSTFLDAEHIVILMQENRSFDHAFGTLKGVRGYNDPRAIRLPNGNPVWVQTNTKGESYVPFRLNLKDTKSTWMGFLPHNFASQVDARNDGNYDHWLEAKRSGKKEYADMPLTLGFYNRDDIPFYYSLADAFTICDQHFCSSITPTLPNRLYYWTGSVRQKQTPDSPALVRNEQIMRDLLVGWTTFPERLEEQGISWKIYQNEVMVATGLNKEEEAWLASFGCNVMEYFAQYHVRANPLHRAFIEQQEKVLPEQITSLKSKLDDPKLAVAEATRLKKELDDSNALWTQVQNERKNWDQEDFAQLTPREKSLYEKAFCTNTGDPDYRELTELSYQDGNTLRHFKIPKGDVLHQFRDDVANGKLPTVSWLVAPERLSDHPESAWYGAWYISESLRILTENPEVWKKTVFILTYDENDGYFDHVPPFVCPDPLKPETGFASKGVDTSLDYLQLIDDEKLKSTYRGPARQSPIGLGYRVPMVIASPWTRGGCVCSQVFDNTSILQFLEKFLTHKTSKTVIEPNISSWRRTMCGDLTSAFQSPQNDKTENPEYIKRDPFLIEIFQSQLLPLPTGYQSLASADITQMRKDPSGFQRMPKQEPGIRRSSPLPYELYVDSALNENRDAIKLRFEVKKDRLGDSAVGCPFTVYAHINESDMKVRNYAVSAGDILEDSWQFRDFADRKYHLEVYGPNGYYRELVGDPDDPPLELRLNYSQSDSHLNGNAEMKAMNHDSVRTFDLTIRDCSYGVPLRTLTVGHDSTLPIVVDTQPSHHWYDIEATVPQFKNFRRRFAGRVETTEWSFSDPAMGRALS